MIRSSHSHMHVAAASHAGLSGKNNEDRYAVTSYLLDEDNAVPSLLAVVADGIGGHRAGEVAAELAVNHITHIVAESNNQQPSKTLERAIHVASQAIASQAASDDNLRGMGATCACAFIIADRLFTASVGDSRIYLLRGDGIRQISVDHTWVQEATDKGLLTPEQAREHPNVHVIRRYLGSPEPPDVDFRMRLQADEPDALANANQGLVLRPSDGLLLCSDGLTDLVWDDEILDIILAASDLQAAAQVLVDTANQRGGHDNITIVLLRVPEDIAPVPPKRSLLPWLVGGIAGALLTLAGIIALGWYLLQPARQVTPSPESVPRTTVTAAAPGTLPALEPAGPTITPGPTYTPWPTHTP